MASICANCKKTTSVGGMRKLLRGNYNPTGKRTIKPNLQLKRLANGKREKLCAKCIKKLYK